MKLVTGRHLTQGEIKMRIKPTVTSTKHVTIHPNWLTAGVATMAISWTFLTVPNNAQAATEPTASDAGTTQTDQQAGQLQQPEVALNAADKTTSTEANINSSEASNGTESQAASQADSTASAASVSGTSASSAASTVSAAPSEAGSVASEATSESAPADSTTEQPTVASSAVKGVEKMKAAAPAARSGVPKAKAVKAEVSDTDIVTISDTNLLAAVKKGLGLAADADLTIGDIRNTKQTSLSITVSDVDVTTLAGLEALSYLPEKTVIKLSLDIKAATVNAQNQVVGTDFDLKPLQNLHFNTLSLYTNYFNQVDLTPLNKIATTDLQYVDLQSNDPDYEYYHKNFNGMTNAQLAQIADWLTDFLNNGYHGGNGGGFKQVGLAGNCITDFSVFSGVNPNAYVRIFAANQTYKSSVEMNIVAGQPITFEATDQIGINGEYLQHQNTKSYSLPPVSTTVTNPDGTTSTKKTWDSVTDLGDGRYQIDAPVQTEDYFTYGQWGFLAHPAGAAYYFDVNYGDGYNSLELLTDAMIYRPANWQENPSIQVNYLDSTTGKVIKAPEKLGTDKKIGETVDLTSYTKLDGYDYVKTDADALELTYTADPQTVNLYFTPVATQEAAGEVTVQYIDTDGNILATGTATYPTGQWVGESYTTTEKAIAGYTFKQVDSSGLAANGTLTKAGGMVTYIYQKESVAPSENGKITIVYVDDTTGKTLTSETITGTQGSASDYQTKATIQHYLDLGYVLVSDEFPSEGVDFDDQAPTYTVHLKHQVVTVADSRTVTQTIHYIYADGTTAAVDSVKQLVFTRSGQRDLVTWATTWNDWQSDQTGFAAQPSPVIAGYQADQTTVAAVDGITVDSANLETTVTYTAVTDPGTPDPEPTPDPGSPDPETPTEPEDPGQGDTINPDPQPKPDPDQPATTTPTKPGNQTMTQPGTSGTSEVQAAHILPTANPVGNTTRPAKATATETEATTLPQTNEANQSRWGLLGSLMVMILGLVGYRHKEH